MIQEIITFVIIGIAVVIAVRKTVKKFRKKKGKAANQNSQKELKNLQHKCSDCLAECMLRDAVSPEQPTGDVFCKRIDVNSD